MFFCSLVPSSLSLGSPDLVHVDRNAEALPRRFVPLSWSACLPCLVRAKMHNGTVSHWGDWRVCELSGPLSTLSLPLEFFAGLQPPHPLAEVCAFTSVCNFALSDPQRASSSSRLLCHHAKVCSPCPTPEFSTFSNFPLSS